MWHTENFVSPARALEIVERLIVASTEKRKVADVAFNLGLCHRHACMLRLLRSFFIQRCRGREFVQNGMSVGETIVDRRQLFLVIDGDETLARRSVKRFRLTILIPAEVEIADVVLNLAGRK